jgi:hypothetical protein
MCSVSFMTKTVYNFSANAQLFRAKMGGSKAARLSKRAHLDGPFGIADLDWKTGARSGRSILPPVGSSLMQPTAIDSDKTKKDRGAGAPPRRQLMTLLSGEPGLRVSGHATVQVETRCRFDNVARSVIRADAH